MNKFNMKILDKVMDMPGTNRDIFLEELLIAVRIAIEENKVSALEKFIELWENTIEIMSDKQLQIQKAKKELEEEKETIVYKDDKRNCKKCKSNYVSKEPMEWKKSNYRGEYLCEHGVGPGNSIHGCDGCCSREDYPLNFYKFRKKDKKMNCPWCSKEMSLTQKKVEWFDEDGDKQIASEYLCSNLECSDSGWHLMDYEDSTEDNIL